MRKIRIGSFFSGVEGGTLALNKDKFKVVCVSEINETCNSLLRRYHPDAINVGDAWNIDTSKLPDFDLLIAGIECKKWSIAGDRAGFDSDSGAEILTIQKILKAKQPEYFLIENVTGMLTHNKNKSFYIILEILSQCGYFVDFDVLVSSDFGSRQDRSRVYIFGIRKDKIYEQKNGIVRAYEQLHKYHEKGDTREVSKDSSNTPSYTECKQRKYLALKRYFAKKCGYGLLQRKKASNIRDVENADNYFKNSKKEDALISYSCSTREKHIDHRIRINCNANTLTSGFGCQSQSSGTYVRDEKGLRCLTPEECEVLQSWPIGYTSKNDQGLKISDQSRYTMCGNGITSTVVKSILDSIIKL